MNPNRALVGSCRRPLTGGSVLLLALASSAVAQYTGEFSAAALGTGDSDALVGLSTSKEYLYAVNLGEAVNLTINGVNFTGAAGGNPSVAGQWAFTGVPTVFNGTSVNPGGVLGQLTNRFIYNSDSERLTLSGLTVGESYVVTMYSKSWEAASVGRRINPNATGASAFATGFTYDQDMGATAQGSLNVLRYTFQAATAEQVLNFVAAVAGTTMHQYGFTVERTFNNGWTSGADWTTATWATGAPVGAGTNANFTAQGAPTSINLDANVTVGHVQFDGANPWTLSSATNQTLTLQADVGGVSNLSAKSGAHVIGTNVALMNNLLKTGAGTVTINGSISGARTIHTAGGVLQLNGVNTYTGETIFAGGSVTEVTTVSDYGVASGIGARTAAMENNSVTGIGLHFQGGTLRFVGSTAQSTNRQIRILNGNGATIDASGTVPEATLSFTHSGPNINLFDTGGVRTLTLTGTNTGANRFGIQLTNQGANATSINKAGAGTWHLTNDASNYTGLTQISGGVLNVSSLSNYGVPSAIGARTATQETATGNGIGIWFGPGASTGTLQYTGASAQSTDRQIRVGIGGATFDASGSLPSATLSFTYSAANTNLYDTAGPRTIRLTGTNTGANTFGIRLTDQNATTGRTNVTKLGDGTWHLTNDESTYGGVTILEQGVLNVSSLADYGVASALGARAQAADVSMDVGLLFRGGTLQYTGATPQSTNRAIRVSTLGGATIDASGANPAATLSFTANSSPDFFENPGDRSLTFTGTNTGANTFGLAIGEATGQTTVNKTGLGTWVLTGTSTYTGPTNVNQGVLRVNGSLDNTTVTVANGATLGGSGSIAGLVTVLGGGHLAPGDGVGTLTLSTLTLANNAVIDVEFNPFADLVSVTGAGGLTLNGGGFNLYEEGGTNPWATNGTYTLLDYAGTYGGALNNLSVLNSQAGKFYTLTDDTGSTTIQLTISDAVVNEWNGGAGNLQWTSSGNWIGGTPNAQGVVAKFGNIPGSPTTVAVSGPKTVGALLFDNANGYTLAGAGGDTITLDNGFGAGSLTVVSGDHVISAPIALAGHLSANVADASSLAVGAIGGPTRNLQLTGPGTLVLRGANDYAATAVTSGTLQVGDGGTSGNLGSGDVTLGAGAGLVFNRSDSFTVANNITGPEATITKLGTGTLTLSGTNAIASSGAGLLILSEGTVKLGGAGALSGEVNVAIGTGTLDLNGNDASLRSLSMFAGAITDSSSAAGTTTLNLNLTGTTVAAGDIAAGATRALAVNLNSGILQIGDGGTVGNMTATDLALGSDTELQFSRSNNMVVPTNIVGGGTVSQNGAGTVVLSGTNSFGVLNVNSGTVRLGSPGALGPGMTVNLASVLDLNEQSVTIGTLNGSGLITDSGAAALTSILTVNQATNSVFTGVIEEGAGQSVGLTKAGAGILTLGGAGANTYLGRTTVIDGTLRLEKAGVNAVVGDILIGDANSSDILELGAADQIGDSSVVSFTAGGSGNSAFFRLNGFNETVRGIQTTAGQSAVLENNGPAASLAVLTVDTAGSSHTYDGIIRNASAGTSVFALTKVGAGTLTLASSGAVQNSSYTGNTTIDEGKLVLENLAGFASPIVINSTEPGALTVNQTTRDFTLGSVLSGSGELVKTGPAALNLTGANTLSGSVVLNDGILGLGSPTALGNATIVLNGGNIRAVNAGRTLTNPVTVNGSFTLGRLTDLLGPMTLNADATITANNPDGPANNPSSIGAIGGNFRVSFAEGAEGIGSGALNLVGLNTNSGGTAVLSGRVNVGGTGALANADLVVNGGELNLLNAAQTVTSLSGSGGAINFGPGHALTVNQAANTTFSGTLTGSSSLTKTGPGRLALAGSSPGFTATLNVLEGAVEVNGNMGGSTVLVNGELGGTGVVGSVVLDGGVLAPGSGAGTLTVGNFDMDQDSVWRFELATAGVVGSGVNDLLQINGTLALDGTLQVVPLPGFGGGTYRLANYTGALSDDLMVLDPAFLATFPGSSIDLSSPGEVNLIVVPEPGSALLLLGGLSVVTALRRRRSN